jgi:hypothetical protein
VFAGVRPLIASATATSIKIMANPVRQFGMSRRYKTLNTTKTVIEIAS